MGIDRRQRLAVFLDRDGVINRAIVREGRLHPPGSVEELEILSGVREALERLHAARFRLIVVTNQPDVARGTQRREVVDAIHARLGAMLPIDEFRVCAHDDPDETLACHESAGLVPPAPLTKSTTYVPCQLVNSNLWPLTQLIVRPSASMLARMFCSNHCSESAFVDGIEAANLATWANESFADTVES